MKVILFLLSMRKKYFLNFVIQFRIIKNYIFILPEYIRNTCHNVVFWNKYKLFKVSKSMPIFSNKKIVVYNFFER